MPQSKPSLLRTVFFNLIFVFLFVLVLLWSLISAYGYQIDPIKRQVIQSGVLSLQTITRGAEISLDNASLTQKTPCTLSNLSIAEHRIKLTKEGYHPWSKNITVQSELVTELGQVKLIPDFDLGSAQVYDSADYFVLSNSDKLATLTPSQISIYDSGKLISSTQPPRTDISALFWLNDRLYAQQINGRIWELRSDNIWQYSSTNLPKISENIISSDHLHELILDDNEIWITDLEQSTQTLFSRFSSQVDWASWYSNTQLIYAINGTIEICDLDQENCQEITNYNSQTMPIFAHNKLYYYADNFLQSLDFSDSNSHFFGIF